MATLIRRRSEFPTERVIDAVLAAPALIYVGDKKYARDVAVTYDVLPNVDLVAIGYRKPDQKLQQLHRHYVNEADVARVSALLRSRAANRVSSITLSMRGQPKARDGSQGWCMESVTFVVKGGQVYATVLYRVAEVIQRLCADFCFLQKLFARLQVQLVEIKFHFCLAYFGAQYLPTLCQGAPPIALLETIREHDHTLWMAATWYLRRYLTNDRPIGHGPADRQQQLLNSTWSAEKRADLEDYLSDSGR